MNTATPLTGGNFMKWNKFVSLLLALALLLSLGACGGDEAASIGIIGGADGPTAIFIGTSDDSDDGPALDEDGWYYSAPDVALYLHLYGRLPDNFITKTEARALGWDGGSVEDYAPGCAIGGDKFGNREGLLPKADGRQYYECDIDTNDRDSRGEKRMVYSNDGLIYYTEDHYESFTLLYGEE